MYIYIDVRLRPHKRFYWQNPSHLAWPWRWRAYSFEKQRVSLRGVYVWDVNSTVTKNSDNFVGKGTSERVTRRGDDTSWQEASEFLCIKTPSCGLLFHVPLSRAEGAIVCSVAIPTSLPCNHVATQVDSGHGFCGSLPAPGAQRPATQARRFCNGRLIKLGGSAGAVSKRPAIFLQPHWLPTAHARVVLWLEVGGERRYICERNPSIELFHRCMSITTETVRWCWCKFACGAGVLGNICVLQNVSPHINPWVGVPFRQ